MKTFLGFLLVVSRLSRSAGATALDDAVSGSEKPCRARAWVRAPDLEPGEVVQGQVKVKLDGACEDVSTYALRLRFSERSWVKTRREGVKLPEQPIFNHTSRTSSNIYDSDAFWGPRFSSAAWEKYETDMKDPSLWLVCEEERIGFEAKYNLGDDKQVGHDLVESFAILVPTTNYPPAFDQFAYDFSNSADDAGTEHIYAYFVDVAFANGTRHEVLAGLTSFNVRTVLDPQISETINVTTTRLSFDVNGHARETVQPLDEFTLEVTFPYGRHVERGSRVNVTVTSHQLGSGRQRPQRINPLSMQVTQKRHWAASFATDNVTTKGLLERGRMQDSQLMPTDPQAVYSDGLFDFCNMDYELMIPRFSQDGVVENGTVFTTKPVSTSFEVPQNCYPSFDMYYQTSEVELRVVIVLGNVSSPDKPPATTGEDEYDWIPTMQETAYLPSDLIEAKIPFFVHPKQDYQKKLATSRATHYLSPDARAPTFMNLSTVTDLLQKTTEERDALAPKAEAKIITTANRDVIKYKYHGAHWWQGQPGKYYVGDVWFRKVILPNKDAENATHGSGPRLVVQS